MTVHLRRIGGAMTARVGLFFLLCILMGGGGWWFAQRPPLVLRGVHEVDGVAVRGGWLDLDFRLLRTRVCDAKVERWLWQPLRDDPDGRRWVQLPESANPPTETGVEAHYVLSLPIPGNVPAGDWNYFSRTRDDCWFSLMQPKVRDSGDIPVHVVNPSAGAPAQVVAPPGPVIIMPGTARP